MALPLRRLGQIAFGIKSRCALVSAQQLEITRVLETVRPTLAQHLISPKARQALAPWCLPLRPNGSRLAPLGEITQQQTSPMPGLLACHQHESDPSHKHNHPSNTQTILHRPSSQHRDRHQLAKPLQNHYSTLHLRISPPRVRWIL